MHGPAELEIADHGNAQSIHGAAAGTDLLTNRVEVEQRLARMFVGTVPAVDDGYARRGGELGNRSLLRVSHHDDIAVA